MSAQREIKFRAWDGKDMYYDVQNAYKSHIKTIPIEAAHAVSFGEILALELFEVMQFTGKYGFGKRELYEGDIVFYEETHDEGDVRYYLVIVWIPEWCMFASLHMSEYKDFLIDGYAVLDETMFWTYTLENSEDYHFAGTIHENPELLK